MATTATPPADPNAISSADIVNQAKAVAQDGRNVTYQVLTASGDNNNNNAHIKMSNGPQSNIQNEQM